MLPPKLKVEREDDKNGSEDSMNDVSQNDSHDDVDVQTKTLIIDGFDGERNEQANKHQHEWEDLCKQEEIFWRQKSREQWLKEEDINTRFFHRSTMEHRSHNRISIIKDSRGNHLNNHKEIEDVLVQHFQGIAEEPVLYRSQFISDFTKHITKLVTRKDKYNLNRPVNEEEVNEVIKDMQNGKAPNSNGFNVDFFKAH
eukprot:PITA_32552